MEIVRKNIHLEYPKADCSMQRVVSEDKIVPDQYPDVDQICFYQADCELQEVRTGNECVMVRGQIPYTLLYFSRESQKKMISLQGTMLLEEKLNMPGVSTTDAVEVKAKIEDFRIQIINSRKISVQAVLHLGGECHVMRDTELPVAVEANCNVECKKENLSFSKLVVSKKDLYRVREEMDLPVNYPNVQQCLFHWVDITQLEAGVLNQRIYVKGMLQVFYLYEGEGEDNPILCFEKKFPVSGELGMDGVPSECCAQIGCEVGKREITLLPDGDGENRRLSVEVSVDLNIKVYQEENMEVVTDVYSVEEEILPEYTGGELQKLITRREGVLPINHRKQTQLAADTSFQILYCRARLLQDKTEMTEEGMVVRGSVFVDYLYRTEGETPYGSDSVQIPYRKVIWAENYQQEYRYHLQMQTGALQVMASSSDEIEAKVELQYQLTMFEHIKRDIISAAEEQPLCFEQMGEKPSMCIYVVKEGDTLWEIGKRYATTIPSILEHNKLTDEEIQVGEKLLLCKEVRRPQKVEGVDEKNQIVYN